MPEKSLKLDPARLDTLAAILRRARATSLGHNVDLSEIRDRRQAVNTQINILKQKAADGGVISAATAEPEVERLKKDLADLTAKAAEIEVIKATDVAATQAARANLEVAIAAADAAKIPVRREIRELIN